MGKQLNAMRPERQQALLDTIDDTLASYDAFREQRDAEDHRMSSEGIVICGLQRAVGRGFMTQGQMDEELLIRQEQAHVPL